MFEFSSAEEETLIDTNIVDSNKDMVGTLSELDPLIDISWKDADLHVENV